MRNRLIALASIAIALFAASGCDTGSNPAPAEQPSNKYVGTWVAVHVYQSGYTDPVYLPIALKEVTHTLHIMNDGSYTDSIQLVYADDSTESGSYSGTYTFTDNGITLTETAGTIEGSPVPEKNLDQSIYMLSGTNTLVEQDSDSAESPDEDASGNHLYPIVLRFTRQ